MKSTGHTWNSTPQISPRLVTTVDRECDNLQGCSKCLNPLWVLDYSKVSIGGCRTGSESAPWRQRSPRVAHLYPPLTPYWEDYTRDAPSPEHSTFILFHNGEDAGLTRLTQNRFRYARFFDRGAVLLPLLEQIARIGQRRGDAGFWEAQALFCNVLGLLLRAAHLENEEYELPASIEVPEPLTFSEQVDDFMRMRLTEQLRLKDIARHFHVSLSSLAHRYRAEAGLSPTARLIQLRIDMARGLLLGGERLDRVAEQTGFYDAYHLSKAFKRLVGLPPRQFLRAARLDVKK
jgi:AraC-like DNA-binding protein